jgi:type VI secretion system protein VasD
VSIDPASRSGSRRAGATPALLFLSVLLHAFVGCSSPPKAKPPTFVAATVEASEQLNPSASRRPSPLLIRVYELKSATAFNGADFMTLYQRDAAELGADVVTREELMLKPGEQRAFDRKLADEVRFIGVVAAYRDLERATWRSVVAVQPNQKQRLVIRARESAIEATIGK